MSTTCVVVRLVRRKTVKNRQSLQPDLLATSLIDAEEEDPVNLAKTGTTFSLARL